MQITQQTRDKTTQEVRILTQQQRVKCKNQEKNILNEIFF